MNTLTRTLLTLCILFSINFNAQADELNCFPESSKRFPVSLMKSVQISEQEFNNLLDTFQKTFNDYVRARNGKILKVQAKWNEDRANAHCTRDDDNNPVIIFNGGLARHPDVTRDGILLILCHELGHYYGGAPKSFRGSSKKRSWSSAEGQADYFATSKCLPLLFKDNDQSQENSLYEEGGCNSELCHRITRAGLAVSRLFANLKNSSMPDIGKYDRSKVSRTNHRHPSAQCRLDTFLAGIYCDKDPRGNFDNKDPKIGACVRSSNESSSKRGARPLCWFNPAAF